MNAILGWIGSILLAFCGMPQAYKSWKEGHSRGLSMGFLVLWTMGEIFTLYALLAHSELKYLMFNYGTNLCFISIIWFYRLFPRK